MRMTILGSMFGARFCAAVAAVTAAIAVAGCGSASLIPPSEQPLSKDTMMLLGRKGMERGAPIFIRIFKEDSELEVWKARDDGRFYHFKTYPICNWSGKVGPKKALGDRQAPEGFYRVTEEQLNPNSKYHLAFNLGYPNAYDRSRKRTGQWLMVHGDCKSAGCYAMTDALIEEIYALAREAFSGGQESFEVHAFPFRMTSENLARHRRSEHYAFWRTLKQGYDHFETYRLPPTVAVCERRYVVNVKLPTSRSIHAERACPRFRKPTVEPFTPRPYEQQLAWERIIVPGPKMRKVASTQTAKRNTNSGFAKSFGLGGPITADILSTLGFSQ